MSENGIKITMNQRKLIVNRGMNQAEGSARCALKSLIGIANSKVSVFSFIYLIATKFNAHFYQKLLKFLPQLKVLTIFSI